MKIWRNNQNLTLNIQLYQCFYEFLWNSSDPTRFSDGFVGFEEKQSLYKIIILFNSSFEHNYCHFPFTNQSLHCILQTYLISYHIWNLSYIDALISFCNDSWRHQAITWTNVDLSSVRSSDILLRAISQQVSQPSNTVIGLKSTHLKFHKISQATMS